MKITVFKVVIVGCFAVSATCGVLAYKESQRTKRYIEAAHQIRNGEMSDSKTAQLAESFLGEYSPFIKALMEVESGNNPDAIGEAGELGILQIRPIMVDEANRILGEDRYRLEDRRDAERSVEMFWVYTNHWNRKRDDYTYEGMSRRWNGGPTGHTKPSTLPYWEKVRAAMTTTSPQDAG